ncbi:hypothetical protein EVAR_84392_1 [Eumeta japonica]|uniref:Uncharacterized protein n=1 Tax=Eumeta variegata TaxID=151549 RepID=A0A4C1YH13_EUMVA|nr:hypothetical protein EVAR_84392_1 [Eumeta japonica]
MVSFTHIKKSTNPATSEDVARQERPHKGVAYFSNGERRITIITSRDRLHPSESALPGFCAPAADTSCERWNGLFVRGVLICEPVTYPKCLRFRQKPESDSVERNLNYLNLVVGTPTA